LSYRGNPLLSDVQPARCS